MKGQEVQIVLKDDNVIFKQPYRYNEIEKTLVQAWMLVWWNCPNVNVSTTMMSIKDIFCN